MTMISAIRTGIVITAFG